MVVGRRLFAAASAAALAGSLAAVVSTGAQAATGPPGLVDIALIDSVPGT